MKKLLSVILCLFITTAFFAEDYAIKLFPWNKKYSEIVSFYMDLGWSMKYDKESNYVTFTPEGDNFFYQNKLLKIKNMFFSFDKSGNIISQNITLDNGYSLNTAYMACITTAMVDSAVFYNQTYQNTDGIDNLYHYLHLDNCNAMYAIVGQDDYYMLFLSYDKMD